MGHVVGSRWPGTCAGPGPNRVTSRRTLADLHQRPRRLTIANAHAALDRAVWAAYGWDDPDPGAVSEDTILARLLALNLERMEGDGDRPVAHRIAP